MRVFLASIALMSVGLWMRADADISPEYAAKAANLPKFMPFIIWPEGTFASATAPANMCVLGPDPFDGKLDQEARAVRADRRPIVVRHLAEPDPQAHCQLIFLGMGNDPAFVETALDDLKGRPVVTVTDSGLKRRGVISFVIQANHVRFDIDEAQAAQDGLIISSKLLGLAHAVKTRVER